MYPVILFVYNRPKHTKRTVEALQRNFLAQKSDLFIFADGANAILERSSKGLSSVQAVRSYIKTITGFKTITITESPTNRGLANSIIAGVTEIISKQDAVIVLEDDLVTSPYFLTYMNESLSVFEDRDDIFSISGYTYPENVMKIPNTYKEETYLSRRFGSTGWGTWKDRWSRVDWEVKDFNAFKKNKVLQQEFNRGGEERSYLLTSQMRGSIDSWAIRFDYAHFVNSCYSLRPTKSLIQNIGFDGSGVHCNAGEGFDDIVSNKKVALNREIRADETVLQLFFDVNRRAWYKKVLDRMPWVRRMITLTR